jgi:hypothetical protein
MDSQKKYPSNLVTQNLYQPIVLPFIIADIYVRPNDIVSTIDYVPMIVKMIVITGLFFVCVTLLRQIQFCSVTAPFSIC